MLCRLSLVVVVVAGLLVVPAHAAQNSLFTFGEMQALQRLPDDTDDRPLTEEETTLVRNMQFYAVSVFEALLAANSAAARIHDRPMFCAPARAFAFDDEGDIAALADFLADELLTLTDEVGAPLDRYDHRPAAEVLLLALRAAFPCDLVGETISAMR